MKVKTNDVSITPKRPLRYVQHCACYIFSILVLLPFHQCALPFTSLSTHLCLIYLLSRTCAFSSAHPSSPSTPALPSGAVQLLYFISPPATVAFISFGYLASCCFSPPLLTCSPRSHPFLYCSQFPLPLSSVPILFSFIASLRLPLPVSFLFFSLLLSWCVAFPWSSVHATIPQSFHLCLLSPCPTDLCTPESRVPSAQRVSSSASHFFVQYPASFFSCPLQKAFL